MDAAFAIVIGFMILFAFGLKDCSSTIVKIERERRERNAAYGCHWSEKYGHEYCPDWAEGVAF